MASETQLNHLVFVYGTLKKGQPNALVIPDLTTGQYEFLGSARTVSKWPLVISSALNIPFLLRKEGHGKNIVGEVYKIDDQKLAFLDDFEGYPTYYGRYEQKVTLIDKPSVELVAWTYFLEGWKPKLLDLEFFDDYDSYGSHGLPYSERLVRTASEEAFAILAEVKHI